MAGRALRGSGDSQWPQEDGRRTSAPNERWVMATSSIRMLNSAARLVSSLRTAAETCTCMGAGRWGEGGASRGAAAAAASATVAGPAPSASPRALTRAGMALLAGAHLVSAGEELLCLVLRHHGLQYLISDGGQHALVPVGAQVLPGAKEGGAGAR